MTLQHPFTVKTKHLSIKAASKVRLTRNEGNRNSYIIKTTKENNDQLFSTIYTRSMGTIPSNFVIQLKDPGTALFTFELKSDIQP